MDSLTLSHLSLLNLVSTPDLWAPYPCSQPVCHLHLYPNAPKVPLTHNVQNQAPILGVLVSISHLNAQQQHSPKTEKWALFFLLILTLHLTTLSMLSSFFYFYCQCSDLGLHSFYKKIFLYLSGCIGSYLGHTGSLLLHVGSSIMGSSLQPAGQVVVRGLRHCSTRAELQHAGS